MAERGDFAACLGDIGEVDFGGDHAGRLAGIGQNLAPGRDDHGMAIGLTALGVGAGLGRRNDEGAILDRPRPLQDMPMGLAGDLGEGRRRGDHAGAGLGQGAVERREANVIADGHAQRPPWGGRQHRLGAGFIGVRFPIGGAIADLHVEHVDLGIARDNSAVRSDQKAAVGEFIAVEFDGNRADQQPARQLVGQGAEGG